MSEELPRGWVQTALREVVPSPRPKASPADHPELPFVGMDHIATNGMQLLGAGRFGDMKSAGGLFSPGDVLYGRMRPYLNKVHLAKQRGACSAEFIVLPESTAIDSAFLAYLLHHRKFVNFASEQSSGDRPRVDFESLSAYEFALPPRAEQARIVSKVDELFSDIEEGERALERVQKLVARYRQSVLKAAVTGELTREWRETGGVQRSTTDESTHLPPGWMELPLGNLATKVTSGSRDWKNYYGRGDGVFIMAQNVRPGRLDLSELQLVDPPEGSRDAIRSEVREGDLLITIVGANTGDVCRVDRPLKKHYVCQSVAMIRLADPQLGPYVELFLMAEEGGQAQFGDSIYGAGRPHLSFDQLKSVLIPVPPADEQVAIIDAVQRVVSDIHAMTGSMLTSGRQAAALRQAVLAAAFRGELVRQDLTNEPASVLLDRIRDLRAAEQELTGVRAGRSGTQPLARVMKEHDMQPQAQRRTRSPRGV
jgi:type I restriction enzyme S subunit